MKKYLVLYKILFLSLPGFSQLTISPGTSLVTNGAVTINMENMSLVNNGTFAAGTGKVIFGGNTNNNLGGTSSTVFNELEMAKTGSNSLVMQSHITVNNKINFISGLIDLNQKNITLGNNAILQNESENSRIIGPDGGEVIIVRSMNKPNSVNAGNLGAILSSNSNLGTVTIRRGHKASAGTGLSSSIHRYFNISNGGNNINATLRVKYFDAELNGEIENNLEFFQSTNSGSNWNGISYSTRNATDNFVEKTGLATLALTTLAGVVPPPPPPPPPVTGLVFTASRTNNTTVQLNWSTQTETNMDGFEVQRRYANETDFSAIGFINSTAPGGNSNTPLAYNYTDANSYTGTTYYRLKVIDLSNNFIYSDIKSVGKAKGGGNGGGGNGNGGGGNNKSAIGEEVMEITSPKITFGPNPNNGNFWFIVSGLQKETSATLYSIDGKPLKQFRVTNQQQQHVNGLSNGIYLLKVEGMNAVKVMVQGSGNTTNTNTTNNYSPKY